MFATTLDRYIDPAAPTSISLLCAWITSILACASFAALAGENQGPATFVALDAGGHTGAVSRLVFDKYHLISVSHDKTIRFWRAENYEPERVLRPPIGRGQVGQLDAAAVSPDGRFLAVGGDTAPEGSHDHRIWVISLPQGQMVARLAGNTELLLDLAFSPDGKWLAAGGKDTRLRIWSVDDWKLTTTLEGHTAPITAVAWNPIGDSVVTASFDRTCRIWRIPEGTSLPLIAHQSPVRAVAWSHDGRTIASGERDNAILLWNPDGRLRKHLFTAVEIVNHLAFSPDDTSLLYVSGGARSRNIAAGLIRVADSKLNANLIGCRDTPCCGAFSPDGQHVLVGDCNDDICVWSVATGQLENRLRSNGRDIYATGWSRDGRSIAFGCDSSYSGVNRATSPLERSFSLDRLDLGSRPPRDFLQAPLQRDGLSITREGFRSVRVMRNGVAIAHHRTPYSQDNVRALAMLSGSRVAVGGDNWMWVFDALTGRSLRSLPGHSGIIWSLAPSPNSRYLLSGSGDQTLEIWNTDRYEHMLSLFVAGEEWIAWTPQGYYAASLGGEELMGWHVQNGCDEMAQFYAASRFHDTFYRPDVIRRVLDFGGPLEALKAADLVAARENQPITIDTRLPPRVTISISNAAESGADRGLVTIVAKAAVSPGDRLRLLQLLVDGRPQGEARSNADSPFAADPNVAQGQWQPALGPGRHTLRVRAESMYGSGLSEPLVVQSTVETQDPPRLFVLAVGVSRFDTVPRRRNFAVADAQAIGQLLAKQSKRMFGEIVSRVLLDSEATSTHVEQALQQLQEQMTPSDVGILYFASRAARDSQNTIYLLTHDSQAADLAGTALSETSLKAHLQQTRGRLVLLLDADVGVEEAPAPPSAIGFRHSTSDLLRELGGEDFGVTVIGAASDGEIALELPSLGRSMFAQAVLDGLVGGADEDKNGAVDIQELAQFVKINVTQRTAGRQRPLIARPSLVPKFVVSGL